MNDKWFRANRVFLVVILLTFGGGAATSASSSQGSSSQKPVLAHFPVTIQDDLGRSFRFNTPPHRIVSLSPGYTETLFALGVGDRVVGVDDYSTTAEAARVKVGGGHHANLERIVALQPDFVVALVEQEEVDALVARGIPAVKLFPKDFEGVLHTILLLGEVTGTDQRAADSRRENGRWIDQIEVRVKGLRPPRVFLELDGTDPVKFTAGPQSFTGDMICAAGAGNIVHGIHTPSSQISLEAIVEEDPEIIVLTDSKNPINPQSKEDVLNRRGWAGSQPCGRVPSSAWTTFSFFVPARGSWTGSSCWPSRIFHPEAFQ